MDTPPSTSSARHRPSGENAINHHSIVSNSEKLHITQMPNDRELVKLVYGGTPITEFREPLKTMLKTSTERCGNLLVISH